MVNTGWRSFFWRKTQTVRFRVSLALFFQRIRYPSNLKMHTPNQETFNVSHFVRRQWIEFIWYFQRRIRKRKRPKARERNWRFFFCLALHLCNFTFYYSIPPTVKTNTHLQFANFCCWTFEPRIRWTFQGNDYFWKIQFSRFSQYLTSTQITIRSNI